MAKRIISKITNKCLEQPQTDPQEEAKDFFAGYYERHPVSEKKKTLETLEMHAHLEEQRQQYLKRRKEQLAR